MISRHTSDCVSRDKNVHVLSSVQQGYRCRVLMDAGRSEWRSRQASDVAYLDSAVSRSVSPADLSG